MTRNRNVSTDRTRLLKFARKQAAEATKIGALTRFSESLRRIDQQAKRIQTLVTRGEIKTTVARRILSKLNASKREISRLKVATAARNKALLRVLDTEIRRAKTKAR